MSKPEDRYKYSNHSYASSVKDVPAEPHFAVLLDTSVSYDAGYGDGNISSTSYMNYITFKSEEALNEWILQHTKSSYPREYKVIRVQPADVVITTTVKVRN